MEEEASRINQGQTLGENSLPSGQSGGRKHGELSLELTSKEATQCLAKERAQKETQKKKETLTNRQALD